MKVKSGLNQTIASWFLFGWLIETFYLSNYEHYIIYGSLTAYFLSRTFFCDYFYSKTSESPNET